MGLQPLPDLSSEDLSSEDLSSEDLSSGFGQWVQAVVFSICAQQVFGAGAIIRRGIAASSTR